MCFAPPATRHCLRSPTNISQHWQARYIFPTEALNCGIQNTQNDSRSNTPYLNGCEAMLMSNESRWNKMGHPGLEPEMVITIQPVVPYPSPEGEVFCLTQKRPSTKGVIPCTPIVLTPTHATVILAVIVIFVQWKIPQAAYGWIKCKKTKPYVAVKRDTQESNPEQRMLHPHYPFRVSPECKQISKGFLPADFSSLYFAFLSLHYRYCVICKIVKESWKLFEK